MKPPDAGTELFAGKVKLNPPAGAIVFLDEGPALLSKLPKGELDEFEAVFTAKLKDDLETWFA